MTNSTTIQTMTAILPAADGPPGTAASVSVAAFAAGQNSRKADNVHAENIPEVLRMRDRLTGEAEVKITGSEIVDRHDRKQRRNDAGQVKVFHEDDVADASCEAHAALLRERADDERRDQRKDNGRVLAAGALGAHGVNAGRRADDEQSGEQDRQDCAAQRLRLIGAASLIRCITLGMGVSILSRATVQNDAQSGRLLLFPLGQSAFLRRLYIVYPSARRMSEQTRRFLDFMKEYYQTGQRQA